MKKKWCSGLSNARNGGIILSPLWWINWYPLRTWNWSGWTEPSVVARTIKNSWKRPWIPRNMQIKVEWCFGDQKRSFSQFGSSWGQAVHEARDGGRPPHRWHQVDPHRGRCSPSVAPPVVGRSTPSRSPLRHPSSPVLTSTTAPRSASSPKVFPASQALVGPRI